ncbi:MAG TPA: hypothetical protein VF140_02610 [Phycicoccus sp.]
MSQYSLETPLGRHGRRAGARQALDVRAVVSPLSTATGPGGSTAAAAAAAVTPVPATAGRAARHADPRPVSVFDATGGARPVHVARRPLTAARWFAAVTLVSAVVTVTTAGEHWTPFVAGVVTLVGLVATVWAWAWARSPQVVIGHRGIWFAATADRPAAVHPWSEVLAVYGETRVERSHPAQVHGVERHVLGVHLRRDTDGESRVVRRSAVSPLLRLHRVVVSVAPTVPVTRQEPWGTQPGQHPLVVLSRRLARRG